MNNSEVATEVDVYVAREGDNTIYHDVSISRIVISKGWRGEGPPSYEAIDDGSNGYTAAIFSIMRLD
jgi:hypothetical protein